jgi:hypothetical protein
MSVTKLPSLDDVLDLLRRLDDAAVDAYGATSQFLEVRKGPAGDGVSVNGNRDGLVHFARLVLEVAAKDFSGAHQHFDEAGELDTCEVPLAITLSPAEWDAHSKP